MPEPESDERGKIAGERFMCPRREAVFHWLRNQRESGVIESEGRGTILMNRLRREALDAKFPDLVASVLAGVHREHRALKRRAN
jgi:hypothetical protein